MADNDNALILKELKAITGIVSVLLDKFAKFEVRLTAVKSDLSAVKSDLSAVKNNLTVVKNDLTGVSNRVTGLEGEVGGLKGQLAAVRENTSLIPVLAKAFSEQAADIDNHEHRLKLLEKHSA